MPSVTPKANTLSKKQFISSFPDKKSIDVADKSLSAEQKKNARAADHNGDGRVSGKKELDTLWQKGVDKFDKNGDSDSIQTQDRNKNSTKAFHNASSYLNAAKKPQAKSGIGGKVPGSSQVKKDITGFLEEYRRQNPAGRAPTGTAIAKHLAGKYKLSKAQHKGLEVALRHRPAQGSFDQRLQQMARLTKLAGENKLDALGQLDQQAKAAKKSGDTQRYNATTGVINGAVESMAKIDIKKARVVADMLGAKNFQQSQPVVQAGLISAATARGQKVYDAVKSNAFAKLKSSEKQMMAGMLLESRSFQFPRHFKHVKSFLSKVKESPLAGGNNSLTGWVDMLKEKPYLFFSLPPKQRAAVIQSQFKNGFTDVLAGIKQENPKAYKTMAKHVINKMTKGELHAVNSGAKDSTALEAVRQGTYLTVEQLAKTSTVAGKLLSAAPFADAALSLYTGKTVKDKAAGSLGNFAVGGFLLAAGAPVLAGAALAAAGIGLQWMTDRANHRDKVNQLKQLLQNNPNIRP